MIDEIKTAIDSANSQWLAGCRQGKLQGERESAEKIRILMDALEDAYAELMTVNGDLFFEQIPIRQAIRDALAKARA